MNYLNQEIETKLKNEGISFVRFVDISKLSDSQNRGFPHAILIGIAINPKFVKEISDNPDYIHTLEDEYAETENNAGKVTDELARFLTGKGYKAISQSDAALMEEGVFNFETKESVLPHKTVALLSGSGWIGKNNLFITPEYGAAECLGTVLTNAPLDTTLHEPLSSKCGNCRLCSDICENKVIKGKTWDRSVSRDDIVDIYGCSICLKCLVHCPWTRKYVKRSYW